MPRIRLFTTPICPYCFSLKRFLEEKGIEVEEIDVTKNEVAMEEMINETQQTTVPVLDIDGEFIVGFDREKICKLLKIED
ncbi:MAG TPA: glutaredoxin domain-containing protein [Candidatus Pacearchaeota archaeon]|mgnify:FL=1|jgi:glutaredoxin 3|nr:glutaredoxin domain-containing protein [Candidatus Pacearchaeota archaeon]HRT18481.1 glutaredoxin domain-containing protein [Candidatus Paceibacterota bacterium]HOS12561.1 glutaredoxin domain-containing protein [Candidatus Pacearchaeota archaeon]HPL72871.1 glutaredoxin domain-containing protein [Candidatus Pacearchaeota archaeon]HPM38918.1 glutaredoxin domain-containing protein [Candidatus Pacearchaeota archaeon]